jgi:hypothetical protein
VRTGKIGAKEKAVGIGIKVNVKNHTNGCIHGFLLKKYRGDPLEIALLNTQWGGILYIYGVPTEIKNKLKCGRLYEFVIPGTSLQEIAGKTSSRNDSCVNENLAEIIDIETGERIEPEPRAATAE